MIPPVGDWELQRIARGPFFQVAMAIGEDGTLLVAASDRDGVVRFTNRQGSWTSKRLNVPSGMEGRDVASLAIDETGRIGVAFERSDCPEPGCLEYGGEILVATVNPSGEWARSTRIGQGLQPSLQMHDGNLHLVYVAGRWSDDGCSEQRPVWYATNETGTWVTARITSKTRDSQAGLIALDSDGNPIVVVGNSCETQGPHGAYVASPEGQNGGVLVPIPGVRVYDEELVDVAVDSGGRVHLVYQRWGDADGSFYLQGDAGEWTEPTLLPARFADAVSGSDEGTVHVVGFDGTHAWHASNATGTFESDLMPMDFGGDTIRPFNSVIAIDAEGNPNVVFTAPDGDGGLWHTVLRPN